MPDQAVTTAAEASRNLLEYGALGAMVVLLAIALGIAMRGWLKAKDAHLADKDRVAKALREQAVEANALAAQTQRLVDDLTTRIDSQDEMLQALGRQVDALALSVPGVDAAAYLQRKGPR